VCWFTLAASNHFFHVATKFSRICHFAVVA
jgi:hypothetical protein